MADPELTVVDVPDDGRYELRLDGDTVGLATYRLADGVITIPHVETSPKHRGKGFADTLMRGILDDVRQRQLLVRPLCPFAAAHMDADPAHHDLLAG
ncbi:GNAT family N-acetyltransferase [Ilumatobacter coccineus]|uniref:Uncharacterized protein n=1 Tax=Ilumatobacter coccineus (strain NBRC 103263 / KCTC 29153 / YM16-304) TaxID=1313172 RepID=A0A6C7E5Y4_ILUCY|nr:GNAT family N-acetyltransferase [Ilumatobacter coccineus]BAN01532.1 hypothetical protein YM304_12180 [Ilumatobacter coccineus YM16-304]